MPVRRIIQERKEYEQTNANAWDENRRQPFDFSDKRDLSIERQELEEEQEIPFGARQIGGVRRVGFRFRCDTNKCSQQDQNDKNCQRDDQVFEDTIRPEEFAPMQFLLITFVDFLFRFAVHTASIATETPRARRVLIFTVSP